MLGRFVFLLLLFAPYSGMANVASATYVQESVATRVDTSANANQTMAGSYTVSGTLIVPTPPLPPVE